MIQIKIQNNIKIEEIMEDNNFSDILSVDSNDYFYSEDFKNKIKSEYFENDDYSNHHAEITKKLDFYKNAEIKLSELRLLKVKKNVLSIFI